MNSIHKTTDIIKMLSNNIVLFSFSLTVIICLLVFYKSTTENKYEMFIGIFIVCLGASYLKEMFRDDISKNNALISSIQETTTSGDFDLLDRVNIKKN